MSGKMKLDLDDVQVATFETGRAEPLEGTVRAHAAAAAVQTVELTTPCCGSQVTCPSAPGIPCPVSP